jgi:hypothetical protein
MVVVERERQAMVGVGIDDRRSGAEAVVEELDERIRACVGGAAAGVAAAAGDAEQPGLAQPLNEFAAVRTEMRDEFLSVRTEMRDEFSAVRNERHHESLSLREEIRLGDEETRRYMRVLHEEVISRIAMIQEGQDGSRPRRGKTDTE